MYNFTTFKFKLELPEGEDQTVDRALNLLQSHLDWKAAGRLILTARQAAAAFPGARLIPGDPPEAAKLALKIAKRIRDAVPAGFKDDGAPDDPKPLASVLADFEPGGLIIWNDVEAADMRMVAAFAQAVQEEYGLKPFGIRWANIHAGSETGGGAVWLERGKEPEWNDPAEWLKGKREAEEEASRAAAGAAAEPGMEP